MADFWERPSSKMGVRRVKEEVKNMHACMHACMSICIRDNVRVIIKISSPLDGVFSLFVVLRLGLGLFGSQELLLVE